MSAIESNRWAFDFLRKRADFVGSHPGIEALIMWGPIVDAIATIHASRLVRPRRPHWKCFQTSLIELVCFANLRTTSVPLLRQEVLQLVLAGDVAAQSFYAAVFGEVESGLFPDGMIWTAEKDQLWEAKIAACAERVSSKKLREVLARTTYAGILYSDYRCPLVHGLNLGWRTWPGSETLGPGPRDDGPTYMNYLYGSADPRPEQHRSRVRVSFSNRFLVRALHEMIAHEERETVEQGWAVPAYATLE